MPEAGSTAPAIYRCRVMHRRPGAPRYRFVYRSVYLLLDIDAIDNACARSAWISRNRFNLFSFHDADHGAHAPATGLRAWIDRLLAAHDVDLAGGRVQLLAMPRVLGYGFHPISVFYCRRADGALAAIVVEVHNTFGEHHFYVLHEYGQPMSWGRDRRKNKTFHVSPFFDRQGEYRFHFAEPGSRLGLGIRLHDRHGNLRIATTLTGERHALGSASILGSAARVPLSTYKVTAAIHWQALKLWWRGARFHRKPKAKRPNVS